ncbi:MAG: SidA/IucD/PvdA family monooxygenase [Solirubrobacteraceae bacterium]
MSVEADLIAVGAGAKAAALAAKVHALNTLGAGPITLRIIEANEPAASWSGRNGMTSGEEPLAITPIKDVGFPYQSYEAFGEVGEEVDRAVMPFSWQRYLIDKKSYARWVDAGSPAIEHREYGQYLTWVLSRATAGVSLVRGRVTEVALAAEEDRWTVDVDEPPDRAGAHGWAEGAAAQGAAGAGRGRRYGCSALVLTGPGVHRHLPHDAGAASRIFHCDSQRTDFARIPVEQDTEIAIVGGGESALSGAAFLRAFRPRVRITIFTPALPMSRGESFLENRVFSNPDNVGWSSLDVGTRRDFFKHCDRGVFDPLTLSDIAYDERCRFVTGRVVYVAEEGAEGGVRVDYTTAGAASSERYDYLLNSTGFDLLEQLRDLFPPAVRAEIERRVGQLWDRPPEAEVPFGRFLELEGMCPRLHIPGLAALSQGPGFANLGCLGLLADRVLQPLVLDRGAPEPLAAAIP